MIHGKDFNLKKAFTSLLLTALLLLTLPSCSKAKTYRDDILCKELADTALNTFDESNSYATGADGFLDDYFQIPDYVTDHSIRFSSNGANLNEVGIFHTADGKAMDLQAMLKDYLADSLEKNEAWYNSYIPEEVYKLRDAEVRTYGNYVIYAILSPTDRASLFNATESSLS